MSTSDVNDSTASQSKGDSQAGNKKENNGKKNEGNNKKGGKRNDNGNGKSNFKGALSEMNGRTFCLKSERPPHPHNEVMKTLRTIVYNKFVDAAQHLSCLFDDKPSNPFIPEPEEPTGNKRSDDFYVKLYIEDRKVARAQKEKLTNTLFSIFEIIVGQCSHGVTSKLLGYPEFEINREVGDCAWLLETVRQICFDISETKFPPRTAFDIRNLLAKVEQNDLSLPDYLTKFLEIKDVAEHFEVDFGGDPVVRNLVSTHPKFKGIQVLHPGPRPEPPAFPIFDDPHDAGDRKTTAKRVSMFSPFRAKKRDAKTLAKEKLNAPLEVESDQEENIQKEGSKEGDNDVALDDDDTDGDDSNPNLQKLTLFEVDYNEFIDQLADWDSKKRIYEKQLSRASSDLYLATAFVQQADKKRYGSYIEKLTDSYLEGSFIYPLTIEGAMSVLSERCVDTKRGSNSNRNNNNRNKNKNGKEPKSDNDNKPSDDTTLVQREVIAEEVKKVLRKEMKELEGDFGDNEGFLCASITDPSRDFKLYVDSGSNVDSCNNPELLTDVVPCIPKVVKGIGGRRSYTSKGSFRGLFDMYLDESTPVNIVSFNTLSKIADVTFDNLDSAIIATFPNGTVWRFEKDQGLYSFDTVCAANDTNNSVTDYCCISTVSDNEKQYHRREVEAANAAGKWYRILARPSAKKFNDLLSKNYFHNCPVQATDMRRYLDIYGPDVATLRGKTKKIQNKAISQVRITLPPHILTNHAKVSLGIDLFFVNGIGFLHTISDKIKFRTASMLSDRRKSTIISKLDPILATYHTRGFVITAIRADGEFRFLASRYPSISFDFCAADDHVPDVERSIQTVKADLRTAVHGLPFKRYPRTLVVELVSHVLKSRNQLPHDDGISDLLSPLGIVMGLPPPNFNHLTLEFGTYCEVFNEQDRTNTLQPRTSGALALTPLSNGRGYWFFNIETGRRIGRSQWTELPLRKAVVDQVEYIALQEKMPLVRDVHLLFERRPGVPLNDDELQAEAIDNMHFGADGDDPDFEDPRPQRDVAVPPTASIRQAELNDLIADAADFAPAEPVRIPVPPVPTQGEIDPVPNLPQEENLDPQGENPVPVPRPNIVTMDILDAFRQIPRTDDSDVATNEDISADSDDTDDTETTTESTDDDAEASDDNSSSDDDSDFDPSNDEGEGDENGLNENNGDSNPSQPENESSENRSGENTQHGNSSENRSEQVPEQDKSEDSQSGKQERSNSKYNLRRSPKKPTFKQQFDNPASTKSYSSRQLFQNAVKAISDDPQKLHDSLCDTYEHLVGVCFNQMSAKAGIKKHGDKAVMALFREFAQLHDKKVMKAVKASDLTRDQRKAALHAINVIKEKRDGKIKGRTCADGRKQRGLYTKEETASPTISNDSMFALLALSAAERRKIVTWDVEGAYLLADQDDYVLLKFTGESVDIMCQVDPKYKDFVCYENGRKVLYLQLLKALYGTLKAALLWYELYVSKLQGMGFVLNPYDLCVANKVINEKQCTVGWYVDDNFATHDEQSVLDELLNEVEEKVGAITSTKGNVHDFLGMNITFNQDGTFTVRMDSFTQECIDEFPDEIKDSCTTPATKFLFNVDHKSPPLNKERADLFRSIVMKIMYLAQRCRIDLQTALAFLCTRVDKATEEDWAKLKRLITYMNGTKTDSLTVGADSFEKLLSFTDVSFAVHTDMRSHTGGGTSFGRGFFMTRSTKQKMNSGSTTEAEVIGAAEYLPNTIWLAQFLKAQGYQTKYNTFYQDNEAAIKLEKFGKKSSSRRSRHFDIKVFNVKDKLEQHDIDVVYCPTDQMVADFFTKPLQGSLFKTMKDVIMGTVSLHDIGLPEHIPTAPKERVENHVNAKIEVGAVGRDGGNIVTPYLDAAKKALRGVKM